MLVVLAILGFAANRIREERAQSARDKSYERIRDSYMNDLKPGITREAVEKYFKEHGVTFRQLDPGRPNATNYDDMVLIAKEEAPFVCKEQNVYVDVQFSSADPISAPFKVNELDNLTSISIKRMYEGCL